MSSRSATRRASPASIAEQHPFLLSGRQSVSSVCAPVRMNRPMTSYPCSLSKTADAELSTPPDMASTTRGIVSFKRDSPQRHEGHKEKTRKVRQDEQDQQDLISLILFILSK